jgi:hypothetical protein
MVLALPDDDVAGFVFERDEHGPCGGSRLLAHGDDAAGEPGVAECLDAGRACGRRPIHQHANFSPYNSLDAS